MTKSAAAPARDWPTIETPCTWSADDALLYAVAVGAGADGETELAFTTENSERVQQAVLPTFAAVLSQRATRPPVDQFDLARALHVGQRVRLLGPLPARGTATLQASVSAVKESSAGTLIVYETVIRDAASGDELAVMASTVLVRSSSPRPTRRSEPTPDPRPPDVVRHFRTGQAQALIYRLCGDRNPLHSDPVVAARAGFDRPILHGLCTYGYACRALVQELCGGVAERFGEMDGRFVGVVYPGSTLEVAIWIEGTDATFRVTADGSPAIAQGRFHARDAA